MTNSPALSAHAPGRLWPWMLLVLAVVPDALPYAGLKSLISDRFNQGDSSTQLFAVAALIGAVCVVPFLKRVRRVSPRRVMFAAATLQACVVLPMALPVSWEQILVLRGVQGAFDLLTLAVLTTVIADRSSSMGRAFGGSSAAIMIGLAVGLGAGGWLAGTGTTTVFIVAGITSLVLAGASLTLPKTYTEPTRARATRRITRRLLTGTALAASDRLFSGAMILSLPLLLAATGEVSTTVVGLTLALPLAFPAIGGYLAGIVVDRIGPLPVRGVGVACAAGGLGVMAVASGSVTVLLFAAVLVGIGVTLTLPTAQVITVGTHAHQAPLLSIGTLQAAGQIGHLTGIGLIMLLTAAAGSVTSGVLLWTVGIYVAWNGIFMGHVWRMDRRGVTSERSYANTSPPLVAAGG